MFERKTFLAEVIGTFILVFLGCGAVVSANVMLESTNGAFGYVEVIGIALAFGIALMAAAYTMGPISGGHFNPAVSIGLALAGRFEWNKLAGYVVAQCAGAILAAAILMAAAGGTGFGLGQTTAGSFGTNGALIMEAILTFMLVFIILGATSKKAAAGFAGLPIGLYLGAAQIVGIPYSGASLNPARSLGPALFVGGTAMAELWIYFVAPLAAGMLAAVVFRVFESPPRAAIGGQSGHGEAELPATTPAQSSWDAPIPAPRNPS
ncbi:MAG: MIP/aquaporin family protein, partial [Phycisphaerae bacterium]